MNLEIQKVCKIIVKNSTRRRKKIFGLKPTRIIIFRNKMSGKSKRAAWLTHSIFYARYHSQFVIVTT